MMNSADRIAESVRRAAHHLPGEAGGRFMALLSPATLADIGAVLLVWAGSHAFGVGEAIDLLLLGTGLVFLGREALDALTSLGTFARIALQAQTDADFDRAGRELAHAVALIGVDTVLALLTRGAIKTYRGRHRPTVTGDPALPAGEGFTDKFGNITYSTAGSTADQALVLYHERVHSALSPKLMRLRDLRADLGMAAYSRSSLLRYIEEALAESYAQLRVNGIKGLPAGIRFPIANGYVTLRAVSLEGGAMTIVVGGIVYAVHIELRE
jgi:hypothetical protein